MVVSQKKKTEKDMVFRMRAISPWACYPHTQTQNVGDSLSQEVRIDLQSTSKYTSNPTIFWHVLSFIHIYMQLALTYNSTSPK